MTNDKTLDNFKLQQAAVAFYRWYLGEIESGELVEHLLSWITPAFDISILKKDLQLTYERSRTLPRFLQRRKHILANWQAAMEGCNRKPSIELAQSFFDQLLTDLEHNTLSINTLSTGMMRISTGQFGDSATILSPKRDCWTIHVTIKGSAIYSCDQDFFSQRGDIFLISPTADCLCRRNPESPQWQQAFVAFHPKADWANWMQWPAVAEGVFRTKINGAKQFRRVRDLLNEIYDTLNDSLSFNEDLGLNLLEQLLIHIKRELPAMLETKIDPRIGLACKIIQDHLQQPLSVEEVASRCHLSPSRLAHLFKQEMHQSLQQYRNRLRMKFARKLLIETRLSIKEIASEAGYSELPQFSRQFQKTNGISPSQFRERYDET